MKLCHLTIFVWNLLLFKREIASNMSSCEIETITSISSKEQSKAGLILPREEKLVQANQDLTWTIPETSNWTKIELIFLSLINKSTQFLPALTTQYKIYFPQTFCNFLYPSRFYLIIFPFLFQYRHSFFRWY